MKSKIKFFGKILVLSLGIVSCASSKTITVNEEYRIGHLYYKEFLSRDLVIDDAICNDYLTQIGSRLVFNQPNVRKLNLFILKNEEINAFAFLGGNIGVHSGLFLGLEKEGEMAAVLAHELAHLTQRHSMRLAAHAEAARINAIAGYGAGAIVAAILDPMIGLALALSNLEEQQIKMISYTRGMEIEADAISLKTLQHCGFDPADAIGVFNKLKKRHAFQGHIPVYLSTHPIFEERIESVKSGVKNIPYKQFRTSENFMYVQARIAALMSNSEEFYEELSINIKNKQIKQFGLAYFKTMMKINNHSDIKFLEQHFNESNSFIAGYMLSESYAHVGNIRKAREIYKTIQNHPFSYQHSLILLDEKLNEAEKNYRKNVSILNQKDCSSLACLKLLAKNHYLSGNLFEHHLSRANYYFKTGQYDKSHRHLNIASQHIKNSEHKYKYENLQSLLLEEEEFLKTI